MGIYLRLERGVAEHRQYVLNADDLQGSLKGRSMYPSFFVLLRYNVLPNIEFLDFSVIDPGTVLL